MSPGAVLAPPLRLSLLLIPLLGACSYPTDGDPRPEWEGRRAALERSDPAAGALGVPRAAPLTLVLDGPPDPRTVIPANLRIFSGLAEFNGTLAVDLLRRRVSFRPDTPLGGSLRHQLYVSGRLATLDGRTLGDNVIFDFTTGESLGTPTPPGPTSPPTARDLQPLWDARCVSCHGGPLPQAGLDLSRPGRAVETLRGVPARQGGWLRVAPGDHARSHLLHKLLDRGGIIGFPMPPGGPPLSATELRRVADWVDGGAGR